MWFQFTLFTKLFHSLKCFLVMRTQLNSKNKLLKCITIASSGFLLKDSPHLTPTTENPLMRGIFAGIFGMVPLVNPMTNNLPASPTHLKH
jgi:hypothetical protein